MTWDPVPFSDTDDLLLSRQRLFLKTLLVLAINMHPETTVLCCCHDRMAQPLQVPSLSPVPLRSRGLLPSGYYPGSISLPRQCRYSPKGKS